MDWMPRTEDKTQPHARTCTKGVFQHCHRAFLPPLQAQAPPPPLNAPRHHHLNKHLERYSTQCPKCENKKKRGIDEIGATDHICVRIQNMIVKRKMRLVVGRERTQKKHATRFRNSARSARLSFTASTHTTMRAAHADMTSHRCHRKMLASFGLPRMRSSEEVTEADSEWRGPPCEEWCWWCC
jgi:hypothetical protein